MTNFRSLHNHYLRTLGIQTWLLRESGVKISADNSALSTPCDLQLLRQTVAGCIACPLHKTRTHTVFGEGNTAAKVMFIGEAPGFHEDQQGKPFVGRAGILLTQMLKAINLTREEIFIANVLKCRPPENRDPDSNEIALCTNYLVQQIELIKPQLLVALGRISSHYLLQTKLSLEKLRNKIHTFPRTNTPLIATYHPAYLLRNPLDKKKSYQDLLMIKKYLDEMG